MTTDRAPQRRRRSAARRTLRPKFPWGAVLETLHRHFAVGQWKVPVMRERGADPYRVLVSTVLSHRTRDSTTKRAATRLLEQLPTPSALASATVGRIRELIHEVGLSESKAKGLHQAALVMEREYDGQVPTTATELQSLPLVGRKTASAVLLFGFGQPAIPVDIHIQRVVNRLGVVRTSTLGETTDALMRAVPREYWGDLNPTLVQLGQNICQSRRPRCEACPIAGLCNQVGVRDQ